MRKPELDELQYDNYILSGIIADLVKENKTLSAKIQQVTDTDMEERIKTLKTVNKRHQEEIQKLREENSQLESMLDNAIEILLAFLFNR